MAGLERIYRAEGKPLPFAPTRPGSDRLTVVAAIVVFAGALVLIQMTLGGSESMYFDATSVMLIGP